MGLRGKKGVRGKCDVSGGGQTPTSTVHSTYLLSLDSEIEGHVLVSEGGKANAQCP